MKTILLAVATLFLAVLSIGCEQSAPVTDNAPKAEGSTTQSSSDEAVEGDEAVARTRRQVEMLDGIYKGGIVLITEHYVEGDEDLPAGTAFKKLFESASKNGWHEVRLVDATGDPYNDENVAVSDFEKQAIQKLKAGEAFVDETITEAGKRYFLAATPIPVVMEKCTMCHSYDMDEKGLVIGALTYRVPIDE